MPRPQAHQRCVLLGVAGQDAQQNRPVVLDLDDLGDGRIGVVVPDD